MKAVMYHYVRRFDAAYPNFRYLDVANFERQLDYFAQDFGFVSLDEWEAAVADGSVTQTGKVVLTFDDAMACHYDYVFPMLRRRGLWGIFYVPTAAYAQGGILDVHQVHLLCGAIDGRRLRQSALALATTDMVPLEKREDFARLTYVDQENLPGVSEFKRIVNYFVDPEYRGSLLADISADVGFEAKPKQFYCSPAQLREMAASGMIIGSHTHTHPVMSNLSATQQESEIRTSFEWLAQLCELRHKTYCHPYGGFHSFDQNTVEILEALGVDYAFNVEPRDIIPADFARGRQFLPRYDCNQFPHGRAS